MTTNPTDPVAEQLGTCDYYRGPHKNAHASWCPNWKPVAEQGSGDRQLCSHCGGNGTVRIHHGVSVCPQCKGDCWQPAPLPQAAVEGTLEPSVVFRESPLTDRDYDEAIEYLQEAKRLGITGCPCGDSGHSAEQCHHNPLVQARRGVAKDKEFRCFHCGEIFDEETGREHFGEDESAEPACLKAATQSPEPSEVGLSHAQFRELYAAIQHTNSLLGRIYISRTGRPHDWEEQLAAAKTSPEPSDEGMLATHLRKFVSEKVCGYGSGPDTACRCCFAHARTWAEIQHRPECEVALAVKALAKPTPTRPPVSPVPFRHIVQPMKAGEPIDPMIQAMMDSPEGGCYTPTRPPVETEESK